MRWAHKTQTNFSARQHSHPTPLCVWMPEVPSQMLPHKWSVQEFVEAQSLRKLIFHRVQEPLRIGPQSTKNSIVAKIVAFDGQGYTDALSFVLRPCHSTKALNITCNKMWISQYDWSPILNLWKLDISRKLKMTGCPFKAGTYSQGRTPQNGTNQSPKRIRFYNPNSL